MPIKDKDGSVYKLRGPNPMMKEQAFWNREGVILLNMKWEEVIYKDQQVTPLKVMDEFFKRLSPNEITMNEIVQKEEPVAEPPKIEAPKVLEPVLPVIPPKIEPKPEMRVEISFPEPLVSPDEKIALHKRVFYCLPVTYKKRVDDVYGDETVEAVYGTKFTFEAVPMENSDLQMMFWTQIELNKGAIIFQKNEEKRWWQIQSSTQDSQGFIVKATISNINPDFSD